MQLTAGPLQHLAHLYSVKTSYYDMKEEPVTASEESLIAVLQALGAPLNSLSDVSSAIREKTQSRWQKPLEPVTVLRENEPNCIDLRLPFEAAKAQIIGHLKLETADEINLSWPETQNSIIASTEVEGIRYITARLSLQQKLPPGYHKLYLEIRGKSFQSLIVSAPPRAFSPLSGDEKIWGVFLPLYSLHTRNSWGGGSYSDLNILMKWLNSLGGRIVGTLPLLASFFDRKFGPGPYLPASRFFWNEFYIDVNQIPELTLCPEARALMNSDSFQAEISALQNARQVKYQPQMKIKRNILEKLAEYISTSQSERTEKFRQFVASHPLSEDYARFRAAGEKRGVFWENWTQAMREGKLDDSDYDEKSRQYYLYSQWICHEQVLKLSQEFKNKNSYLYLDFPVGVHPYSFDVWKYRDSFINGLKVGAPPDPVFTGGQNWSFPPPHPDKMREQGYDYIINSLRHQLECAGMLRIDHMMGFHRLFCIPDKMENHQGLYVTYPAEELYAILVLESFRHQAVIIGEDLGMVPPEVRPTMAKNGIFRMFIGQYELICENHLGQIPSQSVGALNTHDMFPFASFWKETDIAERYKLKLIDQDIARRELEQRHSVKDSLVKALQNNGLLPDVYTDVQAVLKAVIDLMACSPEFAFLINMEDLWMELQPQNIPSTNRSKNWSRKARYPFEQFSCSSKITNILREVDRLRKGNRLEI